MRGGPTPVRSTDRPDDPTARAERARRRCLLGVANRSQQQGGSAPQSEPCHRAVAWATRAECGAWDSAGLAAGGTSQSARAGRRAPAPQNPKAAHTLSTTYLQRPPPLATRREPPHSTRAAMLSTRPLWPGKSCVSAGLKRLIAQLVGRGCGSLARACNLMLHTWRLREPLDPMR